MARSSVNKSKPCKCRCYRQTEGVTGSHSNLQRGETREGAAQKETMKNSGKGNSKGPTREQRGPVAPKT